jgi:single-strand DNA-binding protein
MLARAHILGFLGGDPEVRVLGNGNKMLSFQVATSRKWRDKDTGERQEKTFWHRVVVYNKHLIEPCEKILKKGSKVAVFGDLETRDYEVDGQKRTITEIMVTAFNGEVLFLDKKEGGGRAPERGDDDMQDVPY